MEGEGEGEGDGGDNDGGTIHAPAAVQDVDEDDHSKAGLFQPSVQNQDQKHNRKPWCGQLSHSRAAIRCSGLGHDHPPD